MAWTKVQSVNTPSTGASSGTSVSVTVSAVGSGNAICGIVSWDETPNVSLTSVTDNQGNTYNLESTITNANDAEKYCAFSRTNITGGPTVITANFSGSIDYRSILIDEFSGGSTASSDERDGSAHGGQYQSNPGTAANAITSGTFTTTTDGDLIWGGCGSQLPFGLPGVGTGFTRGGFSNTDLIASSEYRTQTTAASGTAATASASGGASGSTVMFMIALKPPGAAVVNLGGSEQQGALVYRAPPRRSAGLLPPKDGILQPLTQFLPFAPVQDFQPPNPATTNISLNNRRAAALVGGDPGNEAPFVPPAVVVPPFGWYAQAFQPPNPATTNISLNNRRAGAVAIGDGGIQAPFGRFLPYGWPIQPVQPPNPNAGNLARNNTKAGALVGGIENIEGTFATAPPVLAAWWETLALPPPRPRWMRAAALEGGIEWGGEQFTIRWINAGWEVQAVQPPAAAKRYRVSVTFDGDEGTEAPFVPPVVAVNSWGFDPALPPTRFARRFDPTYIENIEVPETVFYPFGFPVQPVQPPHPARERRFAAMTPISNVEAVFVPPIAVPLQFWQTDYPQPPHLRRERAGAIMPLSNIEGVFTFTPPAAPTMWESQWPQPPHPRPEQRAAAVMPQSPVEGRFASFRPYGWHVPAPEPHRRSEKAGAIVPALTLVDTPLTRFIPFWMMAPPHPEPHPRREKAGSIVPPLALTESQLRVFYPTFWHVLPPEPRPRQWRGAALFEAGILPIIKFRAVVLNPNYIATGRPRVMVSLGAPRQMIGMGAPRNRVVLGITNQVSQTNELLPPIDSTVEIETVTFDFGLILVAGVTITGVTSLTCEVVSGTDPNPASRLVGSAAIVASPNSGGANQAVAQLVGTMLGGVTYRLQCVATSSDGQTISLWNHLTCQTPN